MNFILFILLSLLHIVNAAKSGTYYAGWPVGDGSWVATDSNFAQQTGIDRYRFWKANGIIYTYELDINVAEVQGPIGGTYTFYDATDEYYLTVFTRGQHTVNFNTADPYILQVKVVEG